MESSQHNPNDSQGPSASLPKLKLSEAKARRLLAMQGIEPVDKNYYQ
jgi:hypothetical protein